MRLPTEWAWILALATPHMHIVYLPSARNRTLLVRILIPYGSLVSKGVLHAVSRNSERRRRHYKNTNYIASGDLG